MVKCFIYSSLREHVSMTKNALSCTPKHMRLRRPTNAGAIAYICCCVGRQMPVRQPMQQHLFFVTIIYFFSFYKLCIFMQ